MKWLATLLTLMVVCGCTRPSPSAAASSSERPRTVHLTGLKQRVDILRDRWGVPHVYAQNQEDLFFANGYINARDRLFQLDLWRRTGTGKLAEVLGPDYVSRDRMARLFMYRGDWTREWASYSPDTRQIATAFAAGVNAYIATLNSTFPEEFRIAGYGPGRWAPEDVVARIAGLSISRNVVSEITRAQNIQNYGRDAVLRSHLLDPPVSLQMPRGLDLAAITPEVVRDFSLMLSGSPFAQGSNNWAVDGSRTETGKPLLASDPHRALEVPSLRRTVHLVAPGWNAIGAGEPALPGIALGHNETIAFGFTITGTDQQDLYVERLNPANPNTYWHNGAWREMTVVRESIAVKDRNAETAELRFTVHGPVIHEDREKAYALRWVGLEPGGAGYLASLAAARAQNWDDFQNAIARFKVPAENMVYADTGGNIGFVVTGLTPIRNGHTGLLPVPGTGEYEWSGFLPPAELPRVFNPKEHFVGTSNNDIRPAGYQHILTYEWGPPYRAQRVREMLATSQKFTTADFERMQYDVLSIPARRFQQALKRWQAPDARLAAVRDRMLRWDARITADSTEAIIFEMTFSRLCATKPVTDPEVALRKLESDPRMFRDILDGSMTELAKYMGADQSRWQLGRVNLLLFRHPLNQNAYNRGPYGRPGDSYTVNAAGGNGLRTGEGASYRQVVNLADWDHSTMTNAPGEVGDPGSPHYSDLLDDWRAGRYHPMPFTRKAVEAATVERITLLPK